MNVVETTTIYQDINDFLIVVINISLCWVISHYSLPFYGLASTHVECEITSLIGMKAENCKSKLCIVKNIRGKIWEQMDWSEKGVAGLQVWWFWPIPCLKSDFYFQ